MLMLLVVAFHMNLVIIQPCVLHQKHASAAHGIVNYTHTCFHLLLLFIIYVVL